MSQLVHAVPIYFVILFNRVKRLEKMEKQVQKRKERTVKLEREALDAQARQVEEYRKDQSRISEKVNVEAKKKVVNANMKTQHMGSGLVLA